MIFPILRWAPCVNLWAGTLLLLSTQVGSAQVSFEEPAAERPLFPNLRVGAGATLVQNAAIESFSFIHQANNGTNYVIFPVPESDIEFEVGPSVGVALGGGMRLPDWLHLEVETGFSLSRFQFRASGVDHDGDLWQIPALVNATVPLRLSDSWEAFGGVGVGAMFGVMELSGGPIWLDLDPPELASVHGTHFTAAGMAQAFAGIRYRLNPASALSLGYRFRGATPPLWNRDFGAGDGDGDWQLDLSRLYSHSVHLMYELNW